ncbi:CRAL/TRIO domain-containing protein [Aulographum hederae CBS 113979]|uniref:CRAL/TRIO domain-containing protein n=1 Tax=Aulographum hederae CBS 113979 TaxID=1176131 RepID=A0A6G1GT58_9PEZI|nr:CRAL/TRIO domain-containing protein [Aulographum hederae CBS 113979]
MASSNDLTKVDSFQYPSGHWAHLSPSQTTALEEFKKICQEEGYYTPATEEGKAASHDDGTLLRYLRARRFDPKLAFAQFKDTEDWRKKNSLEELYETIDVQEYDETRRLYPQWTGRRDRRGIPLYVFEVSHLNSKTVSAYESSVSKVPPPTGSDVPTKMLRLFALYENLTRFVMPLCSAMTDRPHTETPITQSNNIVDISKVGLKQFWNLKNHMQDASTLATAHYPETLDRIFIIGAPSFFPTVWGWIKRWFDPITVSKIFILSNANMKKTLEEYIDPANIPKKYGGKLEFEFGMMPVLDPSYEANIQWVAPAVQKGERTIPSGPIKWREHADGKLEAVAVGTENGKKREQTIATVHSDIRGLAGISRTSSYFNTPTTAAATSSFGAPLSEQTDMTTSGIATHPPESQTVTPGTESPKEDIAGGILPRTSMSPTSPREGTSATRFEQQNQTLAAGTLEAGTPAVRDNGLGDKTATMEPSTVGQAPKDVGVQSAEPPAAETQPGYVEQAKEVAGNVYEGAVGGVTAAMGAVGLAGAEKKKEDETPVVEDKGDERVDGMEGAKVEEFLRSKTFEGKPEVAK